MEHADFIIIGAGIAGSSAASELAAKGRVVLLERESQPGYHSTGRSAASYEAADGVENVRKLILAGGPFLQNPPEGFCDEPLLTPRGSLAVFREGQEEAYEEHREVMASVAESPRVIGADEIRVMLPVISPDYSYKAIHNENTFDINVHGLHQGYLRKAKAGGCELFVNAEVVGIRRSNGGNDWIVESRAGEFQAPVLVNAAGAWVDVVAEMAGVSPIGLQPRRRNAVLIKLPDGMDPSTWPLTFGFDPLFYFKPDAGRLMISPMDQIPSEPCDARPDDIDIAIAIDLLEKATTIKVTRPEHVWAGLRSFVEDEMLVSGFDPHNAGFYWLTGQGGYGIETSPAMKAITGALAVGDAFPAWVADFGLSESDLSPARLR